MMKQRLLTASMCALSCALCSAEPTSEAKSAPANQTVVQPAQSADSSSKDGKAPSKEHATHEECKEKHKKGDHDLEAEAKVQKSQPIAEAMHEIHVGPNKSAPKHIEPTKRKSFWEWLRGL